MYTNLKAYGEVIKHVTLKVVSNLSVTTFRKINKYENKNVRFGFKGGMRCNKYTFLTTAHEFMFRLTCSYNSLHKLPKYN